MHTYVALLRGINVGGNNKVEMKKLKAALEELGYKNVQTYINSGNVIYDAKKADAKKIEKHLEKTFGFPIRVLVREAKDLETVCKKVPEEWVNNKEQKTDVLFLWEDFASKKTLELLETTDVDTLEYVADTIVWHIDRKDYNKSGMHDFIGTDVYKNMTARNINTVRKLWALIQKRD